jgi:TIR domain
VGESGDKLKVFISYSRDDLEFADQLDASLELGGFETTIDRRGMSGGEDWKARLGALIRDADTVVFVLSPSSAQSDICVWEVGEAVQLGKRIIPVLCRMLGDAKAPQQLADRDYIYFYPEPKFPGSGFGPGLKRLAAALNTDLDWVREHRATSDWQRSGRRSASRRIVGSCPPPTSRSRRSGRRAGPPRRRS